MFVSVAQTVPDTHLAFADHLAVIAVYEKSRRLIEPTPTSFGRIAMICPLRRIGMGLVPPTRRWKHIRHRFHSTRNRIPAPGASQSISRPKGSSLPEYGEMRISFRPSCLRRARN